MKVGILIKKPENIFSNGCVQQALFLKKVIENTGHCVNFLSIEANYTSFEITNDEITYTDENFDFSDYFCIILASLVLLPSTNALYIQNIKKFDLSIINLVCGNLFILNQEEFVFDIHNILHHYTLSYFTLNWVLEMYNYSKDYIQLLTKQPTDITPYVWDTDIIQKYNDMNKITINICTKDNSKINLLIFEPNMSIHKNALVPLLIAEDFNTKYPNRLNKIYLFCSTNIMENNQVFLKGLSIYKHIESYGRIVMPYILHEIEKNNNYLNIVLSYTLLNNLNFIHLELFHLQIPIIHNCEPFKLNKMYFEDDDLLYAVELIENTRIGFDKCEYKINTKHILDEFSSKNTNRINNYKHKLDDLLHIFRFKTKQFGFCIVIDDTIVLNLDDVFSYINEKFKTASIEIYHYEKNKLFNLSDYKTHNKCTTVCVNNNTSLKDIIMSSSFKTIYLLSASYPFKNFEIYTK